MPTNTGVSEVGTQTIQQFQTLTVAQFSIEFFNTPTLPFKRVGYFYVFAVQSVSPFQARLISLGPVYRPGTFNAFPNNYGFSAARYTIQITWDVSGLAWRCNTI